MMSLRFRHYSKILRLITHIFYGTCVCIFIFPWLKTESRIYRIQSWSKRLLAVLQVRAQINSAGLPSEAVVVSNHVSWLDIFVINSLAPCRFVAKSDISSWPLLGWMAEQGGTIFIARGSKADLKRIYHHLIERIKKGERVAFFPEGAVASQGKVLPFHANLFEPAIYAKVPIQPLALRYTTSTGELHPSVEFGDGINLIESLVSILKADEIRVELMGLELISSEGLHRRELATIAQNAVLAALQSEIRYE
jgi:1-acyl-sn-glycerol-3-phosphate acyltransferase